MKHFNFKKIASIASSALMISSTVALAAAANYPMPFVKSGKADVAIVVGSSAAATDSVAATDIAANLATALAGQDGGDDDSGSSVEGGDFVLIEKSSDKLNLGNSMSGVFGSTVDDGDLAELLADTTYENDENTEYDYDQRLTLQPLNLTFFTDSDLNDDAPTLGFNIPSGQAVLNYTLDFSTDAESDVVSGDLADFETTDVTMLGKSYYILDAQNGTNANYLGKFTLLDSANTATVQEGDTQTVTVGDKQYEVSVDFINEDTVGLVVNGETTNDLEEGETQKLSDDVYIGIKNIRYNSKESGISSVEFSVGSGKLELTSGSNIELNDDSIDGVKAWIVRGSLSSGKQTIDKIIIEWITDEQEFIADGNELVMPGFEAVKFSMGDFVTPEEEMTTVTYSGEDKIQIETTIKDGEATIPLLFANSTGEFTVIGEAADKRLATSPSTVLYYNETIASNDYHNWFVATYNTTSDAESYLLQADIERDSDSGKNKTTIRNVVTGDDVCNDLDVAQVCDFGDVSFTITEANDGASASGATFTAGTNVNFNTVFTAEGLKIYLPFDVNGTAYVSSQKGAINLSQEGSAAGHSPASYFVFFDEENKDDDKGAGTSFNVTVDDDSDGDVHVSDADTGQSELEDDSVSADDTWSRVYSDLATLVHEAVSSDRGKAEITYSGTESYGEVYLTAMDATVATNTTGSSELGNVVVTDTQASTVSSKNMIVVGGSCINTVAASLLGSTSAICGADFTTKTTVGSGQFLIETFASPFSSGKVAVLVAGYNAEDTTNAAKFLTTQTVDTTTGKKYVGTSATSATLQTE